MDSWWSRFKAIFSGRLIRIECISFWVDSNTFVFPEFREWNKQMILNMQYETDSEQEEDEEQEDNEI